ncbi:hypothetical protein RSOLAG1IB_12385 [Rhizoctonia solani AG-1 IB]|uniref:Uncharacterized protein n=1 Tax=Thanatephorus cucumeris (strain AG1-IB / isolate 7/3/14) TaxID=1108050 RepID=A0A0B7FRK7_THACB|nr:hypothetical protein RSOLAG1IB_12385 [Rhizoctonia solani AG-1 IB]
MSRSEMKLGPALPISQREIHERMQTHTENSSMYMVIPLHTPPLQSPSPHLHNSTPLHQPRTPTSLTYTPQNQAKKTKSKPSKPEQNE